MSELLAVQHQGETDMRVNWQNRGAYHREWCNMLGLQPCITY